MKIIPPRYEFLVFALLMSFITSFIVSGLITAIHNPINFLLIAKWLSGALLAWPIVFISILLIAPRLQMLVKKMLKETSSNV